MDALRRQILGAGLALGAGAAALASGPRQARAAETGGLGVSVTSFGVDPASKADQSQAFQQAIDTAAEAGTALLIPPGRYLVANLSLHSGTVLIGVEGLSWLDFAGGASFLAGDKAHGLILDGLVLDGSWRAVGGGGADALLSITGSELIALRRLTIRGGHGNGIALRGCAGQVTDSLIEDCGAAAILALDSTGLEIAHNRISKIGNNGIQVWRSETGEDGTTVLGNRIAGVEARGGGTGENGNGVSLFRAGSVLVSGNRITDCAFSAVRANASSNAQMIGNSCERIGEVALYAEFAFEGVVISSNLVDGAAQGVSVTNFNEGGRLAVVSSNLVRNLVRREESEDKRGVGISVEADASITGNVVESAPTAGILVGWGAFKRDVAVIGNLVRKAKVGIGISSDPEGGLVFVSQNMIAVSADGAIRAMDGLAPLGPDLTRASAEAYPNFAILANVATGSAAD
ncbi:MAG: TIGR03808 family TAT-translocated repetitive protein [Hyphomicrobiaceae bacterium]